MVGGEGELGCLSDRLPQRSVNPCFSQDFTRSNPTSESMCSSWMLWDLAQLVMGSPKLLDQQRGSRLVRMMSG